MLRFGVIRPEQFQESPSLWHRLLHGDRISYLLLRDATPRLFEYISAVLQLSSGVFRTTAPNRFANLDPWILEAMQQRWQPTDALEIHDMAASDGVTSVEWFTSIRSAFPVATMVSSDWSEALTEVSTGSGSLIFDAQNEWIQYVKPPFVVRPKEPRWMILQRALAREGNALAAEAKLRIPQGKRVSLVHPKALALAAQEPGFTLRRHSVFEPLDHPVHVIRTMNILNPGYFPQEQLRVGIGAVRKSLLPGGLWILGRTLTDTNPPTHRATMFERTTEGVRVVQQMHGGSEIENLALDRKSTRLNSSHIPLSRMPSSA